MNEAVSVIASFSGNHGDGDQITELMPYGELCYHHRLWKSG